MAYAQVCDFVSRGTSRDLHDVAADVDTGHLDKEAIQVAIDTASDMVDGYLRSGGYTIADPLTAPNLIKDIVLDIAQYKMASASDELDEEWRVRYQDAIKWLKDVANGKADPGIDKTVSAIAVKSRPSVFGDLESRPCSSSRVSGHNNSGRIYRPY